MTPVLVDSDVLMEVSRRRVGVEGARWKELVEADVLLACSPVSRAELEHGARPGEEALLEDLFSALLVLPIDDAVGAQAGKYLRQYHRSHAVELGDALIAATAFVHGFPLWTRNRKHFPMRDITLFR
jgi:predicted nucleic acid-binding protein